MEDRIIINPKELTPSMKKYEATFYKKSIIDKNNNISPSLSKGLEKACVVEWSDGWAEFNVNEDALIIHTLFSEKNTKFKFEYLYELAKCLDKKQIIFETERNPKAWIRLINSIANKLGNKSSAIVKSYVLGVALEKGE